MQLFMYSEDTVNILTIKGWISYKSLFLEKEQDELILIDDNETPVQILNLKSILILGACDWKLTPL